MTSNPLRPNYFKSPFFSLLVAGLVLLVALFLLMLFPVRPE